MGTLSNRGREHLLAVVILLAGSVLVGARLGSQSLWLDEALTLLPVLRADSLGSLLDLTQRFDTQPPASHLLLYWLLKAVPNNEFFFRLPSLLTITAGVWLLYLCVSRYWGRTAATTFVAFSAFSPLLAFYSMEARNYGLWFLVVAASLLCFSRWLDAVGEETREARPLRWAVALGVVNGLGLLTHLFHIFVIGGETAAALVVWMNTQGKGRRRGVLVGGGVALAAAAVVFAPWFARLAAEISTGEAGVPWTRDFTAMNVPYYMFAAHFGTSFGPNLIDLHIRSLMEMVNDHPLSMSAGGVAVLCSLYVYARLVADAWQQPKRRWELLVLVVLPWVVVAPPLAYGALLHFPLHIRHLLCAWPLLPLVLALGVVRYRAGTPIFAGVMLLGLISLGNLLFNPYYSKADARGAVRYAESQADGKAYVLGDVAPLYALTTIGELRGFDDFPSDTDEVWIVDTRRWSPTSHKNLVRAQYGMRQVGLKKLKSVKSFHGVVLKHWGRPQ